MLEKKQHRRHFLPSGKRVLAASGASLAVFAFVVAYLTPLGLVFGNTPQAQADTQSAYEMDIAAAQSLTVAADATSSELSRGDYSAEKIQTVQAKPASSDTGASYSPPSFVAPDPGTAKAIAYTMVTSRGWGDGEFACLVALWNRESGWRTNAYNSSGAYGIAQALPGNKMSSAGADWATNPATQITWGLGYISGRYGSPCGAWAHSNSDGWY